jgi:4-hydroxy-2-oxoglutarate aldolase
VDLRGVFPPIITPFIDDRLHISGLRSNVRRWMTTGLRGLVALGSNGEAPLLSDEEADQVIATVREELSSDRLLIAGTGRQSTPATIAATRRAAQTGADAVLVLTPGYFRSQMTTAALVDHYQAVADASAVPVLLYNFTAVTGVTLQVDAVARLAEHPNILGIKESGGDVVRLTDVVLGTPPGFRVMAGAAPTFYASLCMGACGGILAAACVVPDLCVRIFDAHARGQHAEAIALQRQIVPLARAVTTVYGVPGLKAAMDAAGYAGGEPRRPLRPVPPEAVAAIRAQLEALEHTRVNG